MASFCFLLGLRVLLLGHRKLHDVTTLCLHLWVTLECNLVLGTGSLLADVCLAATAIAVATWLIFGRSKSRSSYSYGDTRYGEKDVAKARVVEEAIKVTVETIAVVATLGTIDNGVEILQLR